MKKMTSLLSVALLALAVPVQSQTPVPPADLQGVISNAVAALPAASSFTNTTFELKLGTRANNLNVENIIGFQYNFTQTLFVGGEIQNGPASTVIDLARINFGVRKAWDTAEVYALAGGGRNWSNPTGSGKPSWEGFAGFGAAYRPFSNGVLSRAAVFSEGLGIWSQNSKRGSLELRGGLTFLL